MARSQRRHPIPVLFIGGLGVLLGCGPINPGSGQPPAVGLPDCVAEVDGVLSPAELPFVPGVAATYVSSGLDAGLAFAPEPQVDDGGVRTWDLQEGPDDAAATLALRATSPSDWFLDAVPNAELSIPVDVLRPNVHALYAVSADGLTAVGLATLSESPPDERTLLAYEAPNLLLPLPVELDSRWGGQARFANATLAGVPNAGIEDWSFEVVDRADALLPGGLRVHDVLAVRSEVRRTVAVAAGQAENTETTWQLQLMAPCVGELATVSSTSDPSLTVVDRMRRLRP